MPRIKGTFLLVGTWGFVVTYLLVHVGLCVGKSVFLYKLNSWYDRRATIPPGATTPFQSVFMWQSDSTDFSKNSDVPPPPDTAQSAGKTVATPNLSIQPLWALLIDCEIWHNAAAWRKQQCWLKTVLELTQQQIEGWNNFTCTTGAHVRGTLHYTCYTSLKKIWLLIKVIVLTVITAISLIWCLLFTCSTMYKSY